MLLLNIVKYILYVAIFVFLITVVVAPVIAIAISIFAAPVVFLSWLFNFRR